MPHKPNELETQTQEVADVNKVTGIIGDGKGDMQEILNLPVQESTIIRTTKPSAQEGLSKAEKHTIVEKNGGISEGLLKHRGVELVMRQPVLTHKSENLRTSETVTGFIETLVESGELSVEPKGLNRQPAIWEEVSRHNVLSLVAAEAQRIEFEKYRIELKLKYGSALERYNQLKQQTSQEVAEGLRYMEVMRLVEQTGEDNNNTVRLKAAANVLEGAVTQTRNILESAGLTPEETEDFSSVFTEAITKAVSDRLIKGTRYANPVEGQEIQLRQTLANSETLDAETIDSIVEEHTAKVRKSLNTWPTDEWANNLIDRALEFTREYTPSTKSEEELAPILVDTQTDLVREMVRIYKGLNSQTAEVKPRMLVLNPDVGDIARNMLGYRENSWVNKVGKTMGIENLSQPRDNHSEFAFSHNQKDLPLAQRSVDAFKRDPETGDIEVIGKENMRSNVLLTVARITYGTSLFDGRFKDAADTELKTMFERDMTDSDALQDIERTVDAFMVMKENYNKNLLPEDHMTNEDALEIASAVLAMQVARKINPAFVVAVESSANSYKKEGDKPRHNCEDPHFLLAEAIANLDLYREQLRAEPELQESDEFATKFSRSFAVAATTWREIKQEADYEELKSGKRVRVPLSRLEDLGDKKWLKKTLKQLDELI